MGLPPPGAMAYAPLASLLAVAGAMIQPPALSWTLQVRLRRIRPRLLIVTAILGAVLLISAIVEVEDSDAITGAPAARVAPHEVC